jgi:hypothetical protein
MTFLLLTGIPRSGTTLAAALLDQMDDTVCLSEPADHVELKEHACDATAFAAALHDKLAETKRRLLSGLPVYDRRGEGGIRVTNYFDRPEPDGIRRSTYEERPIARADLSPDLMLCAKHNALYAAALPALIASGAFRVIAMVRDPVAVLTSWRSLNLPVSQGRLPAAMKFWPEMAQITEADEPLLTKQIRIYDLLCRRTHAVRNQVAVLSYETLVADSASLAKAAGRSISVDLQRTWQTTINAGSSGRASDGLGNAVRDVCTRERLTGLLAFYPQYG